MRLLLASLALVAGCAAPTVSPPAADAAPASACRIVDGRADTRCTPGVVNPLVTQANIATTICRKGWTDTVRPSSSYTNRLKREQMRDYGLTMPPSDVEEDHLIPLVLGGHPTDPNNLFPEPWEGARGAHAKDGRERALARAVCNLRVTLAEARRQMVAEWTHGKVEQ